MKIAVPYYPFSKNNSLRKNLLENFPDTTFNDQDKILGGKELIDFLRGAEGAIIGLEKINEEVLSKLPNLKIISKYGVGLDNIDLESLKKNKVKLGWTPGLNKRSVAEVILGKLLGLSRNMFLTCSELKKGIWNKSGGSDLSGKTIGLIGVGNIGKELIALLEPFNCKLMANDIVDLSDYYKENNVIDASKEEIYKEADFVSLHLVLTKETKFMINKKVFKTMKSSAFIINCARGLIINYDDLLWALKNKEIAGAGLDVFHEEPPKCKELLSLPNVVCTPHIGANSKESVLAMGESAIEHLVEFN